MREQFKITIKRLRLTQMTDMLITGEVRHTHSWGTQPNQPKTWRRLRSLGTNQTSANPFPSMNYKGLLSHSVLAVPHVGAVAQVAFDAFRQLIQLFDDLGRESQVEGG